MNDARLDPETIAGLLELEEGSAGLLEELRDLFREQAPECLARMRTAAAAGDVLAIHKAAHSLKGSCGNLGAVEAASLARAFEIGPIPADWELRIAALENELSAALAAFTALVDENARVSRDTA